MEIGELGQPHPIRYDDHHHWRPLHRASEKWGRSDGCKGVGISPRNTRVTGPMSDGAALEIVSSELDRRTLRRMDLMRPMRDARHPVAPALERGGRTPIERRYSRL